MDTKAMKQVAKAEVKGHEKRMHGKKFRAGGKTNLEMKKLGRGLAKVANQKSPVRKVRATGI
jgi:hypothetical protein